MKVVILAGGKGNRMGHLTKQLPKPMLLLGDKPILEYQIKLIKRYDLNDITILTHHKGNVIKDYFTTGENWGVKINYCSEPIPLGTAGSVKEIENLISEPFLLLYGDTMIDINLTDLIDFHYKKGGVATLVVHPNDHPHDSDLLNVNKDKCVTEFYSKPHKKDAYHRNLVNAALYVLSPEIFKYIKKDTFSDFGKDIFPYILSLNKAIYVYNTTEYIKDIGTVERLKEVEKDYLSGKVQRLNRSYKQKAIFIDRDGVINYEADPLDTPDKFNFLPEIPFALKKINMSDYLSVLVTNQPIIAKGFISEDQLYTIHNYMEHILGNNGAYFDRIYYCPHHPEKGFKGEHKEYKIACKCRKPETGMIDQAVQDMNINLDQSFIIGDRTVDIMTGNNANLHTILLRQGYAGEDKQYDCKPDFIFNNLLESVEFIINGYDRLSNIIKVILLQSDIFNNKNPIIAVGGLSRSGKSTLSAVISQYLKQKGKSVKILALDNWLFPKHQRMPAMNVRDRYQYSLIRKNIKALLEGETIIINKYHPKTREVEQNASSLFLKPNDILLIEGVVALDHDYVREKANITFFTEINEQSRKKRFFDYYHYKLLTEDQINSLYDKRNKDEVLIIEHSKDFSDHTINMDLDI